MIRGNTHVPGAAGVCRAPTVDLILLPLRNKDALSQRHFSRSEREPRLRFASSLGTRFMLETLVRNLDSISLKP